MANGIHIVFCAPPDGVPEEEFDAWYQAHLGEVVAVPGFLSGQRYRMEPNIVDPRGAVYRHLTLYEFSTSPAAALAALGRAGLGSADEYDQRKAAGSEGPRLPDWFERVSFASWHCVPIGERVQAVGP